MFFSKRKIFPYMHIRKYFTFRKKQLSQPYKNIDSKLYVLVSYFCTAVPYFRSLSLGLKCSIKLAECVVDNKWDEYKEYVWIEALNESLAANIKTAFYNLLYNLVKISNNVPWQINKWSASLTWFYVNFLSKKWFFDKKKDAEIILILILFPHP